MGEAFVAKIAVSSISYGVDRPYTYIVPDELQTLLSVGSRVVVPFGRSNGKKEGIILGFDTAENTENLKQIESSLDDGPILTDEQMKLAMWMRDRFFCTFYDAVHAMLPIGIWFKDGSKRIGDKTSAWVVLTADAEKALEEAQLRGRKAPKQADVLRLVAEFGEVSFEEIKYFTGASMQTVRAIEKQGLVAVERREEYRRPEYEYAPPAEDLTLNETQERAYEGLTELSESGSAQAALVFGVTGSGKTAVYINLIKKLNERGRGAIVLVPEIALTPQLVYIFSSHFGDEVAVLHSALSIGERYDEWKRIRSGGVRVVVGTRTAVFAPVKDLGAIIIDEEQEHTYKSGSAPRYHTRDVAKFRCSYNNALLVLGSATPAIESMKNALDGKYKLFTLDKRFNEQELPNVMIADMRRELKNGNGTSISSLLAGEIGKNLERGEQSILFINRRGAASVVICGECGHTFICPSCSVSMTYHSANNRMMCHYCGHSESVAEHCPECGGRLKFMGVGTQKVEEELKSIFPGIDVVRMDFDTVSHTRSHEKLLNRFRDEKVPVLLGTQMVTKGLDFENVTLIGVISADQSLYSNDYRAHERTFSLITQVVGRAGRGQKKGRAVIQTFTPHNEVIELASQQDYMKFFDRELEIRKLLGCPPIADIIMLKVSGNDERKALTGCMKLKNSFMYYFKGESAVKVLGPAPARILKMSNKYRYQLSISCKNTKKVRNIVAFVMREFLRDKENRGLTVVADVNPDE